MDKILRELSPSTTYKLRYRAVYNDGEESAPTIAYSITTPDSPNPPKVDQTTIQVDSQSLAEGIIISWTEPAEDPAKPAVADYFVQITDDLDDWQKFEIATTDPKTIFTDNNHNVFFGYFAPIIYIRVFARGSNKQFEPLEENEYYEYSYAVESGLRPPDIFVASVPGAYRYELSWAYLPERPDIVTAYKIYEASLDGSSYGSVIATITDETDSDYSAGPLLAFGGQTKRFAITALDASNNESSPRYSNVITIGVIDVDFIAPPQRENINFSADPNSSDVIVTWTNTGLAADEVLNSDLAGVTIRYSLSSDPTDYFWQDVPFTYADNVTTARVMGLISNTEYQFQLSTFDVLFNRSEYSPVDIVTTQKDNTPPPKPAPPTVSGGSANEAMIVRVWQYARQPDGNSPDLGTGTPLPPDTSYFQVWMLNAGQTTAPTGATNPNATLIGDMPAGFNGLETQKIFYVSSIAAGTTRYFYVRAVDTSGNISEASSATESTQLVYFGDAHVDRLSAGKLKSGSISADTIITVGTTANSIKIDGVNGSLYSGIGTYANQNTGFYLDDSGVFSLKDRLKFNGETLSITGDINAQSGSFTGNLGITGSLGAIYIGNPPTGGNPQTPANSSIVLRQDGIVAKNSSGEQTFLLSSSGDIEFNGTITGARAVFDKDISSNPPGISERRYYTSAGAVSIPGFPSIEIRKQTVDAGLTGYISLYRQPGANTGISFFARASDDNPNANTTIANLRAQIDHISSGTDGGGTLRLLAYGSSTGNTAGRIRIEALSSSTSEPSELTLQAERFIFKRNKINVLDTSLTGQNAAILGINVSTGRVGVYAKEELTASAVITGSTPTNASAYPVGALIAVV